METLWSVLNVGAWVGWTFVLGQLLTLDQGVRPWIELSTQVISLELLCCLEVLRMLLGSFLELLRMLSCPDTLTLG